MNTSWFKDRNAQIIAACVVALVLVYTVDAFRLAYRFAAWESLGATSVVPKQLLYFVADTPSVIGYVEKESGQYTECATAVAYVTTASGDLYRCCQTDTAVSCTTGPFASEIVPADTTCNQRLADKFGVPASLPTAKDYQLYGVCAPGGSFQLTVAQIHADDQIQWKAVNDYAPSMTNGVLRFLIGPALLILLIRSVLAMRYKPVPEREIRRW